MQLCNTWHTASVTSPGQAAFTGLRWEATAGKVWAANSRAVRTLTRFLYFTTCRTRHSHTRNPPGWLSSRSPWHGHAHLPSQATRSRRTRRSGFNQQDTPTSCRFPIQAPLPRRGAWSAVRRFPHSTDRTEAGPLEGTWVSPAPAQVSAGMPSWPAQSEFYHQRVVFHWNVRRQPRTKPSRTHSTKHDNPLVQGENFTWKKVAKFNATIESFSKPQFHFKREAAFHVDVGK